MPLAPAGHGTTAAVAILAAFHLGRIASYAIAGAVAAAGVDGLVQTNTPVAALRLFWVLLHVFVFAWARYSPSRGGSRSGRSASAVASKRVFA
ncbi:sulfite exporter TauE/SafE family protein [Variovorax sp. UMC13]|uniref:urease accessory protein UreH domain-containing protein n=1 Tax=Variovorax sp. UMC13 TaxID=1862326 RepID=UPI0021808664|nr:sulfite exporter TauE/SafE family protein [Variovorax sp. UMC13]